MCADGPTVEQRRWHRHPTGGFDYEGEVRRAMSATTGSTRQVVSRASGQEHIGLAARNTSHLLVEEICDLESCGDTTLSFFDPIRLMQHALDHPPRVAQHYGEAVAELGHERR